MKGLLASLGILFLISCSTGIEMRQARDIPEEDSAHARVYFIRVAGRLHGAAIAYVVNEEVSLGKTESLGALSQGQCMVLLVAPGKHKYFLSSMWGRYKDSIALTLEPKQTYYLIEASTYQGSVYSAGTGKVFSSQSEPALRRISQEEFNRLPAELTPFYKVN